MGDRTDRERKLIRSFTSIWRVDRVIYSIGDFALPFPLTMYQVVWFVVGFVVVLVFGDVVPLALIPSALIKYIGLPAAFTALMTSRTFDGKRPYRYLYAVLRYYCRPKLTYAHKPVRLKGYRDNRPIVCVRGCRFAWHKVYTR